MVERMTVVLVFLMLCVHENDCCYQLNLYIQICDYLCNHSQPPLFLHWVHYIFSLFEHIVGRIAYQPVAILFVINVVYNCEKFISSLDYHIENDYILEGGLCPVYNLFLHINLEFFLYLQMTLDMQLLHYFLNLLIFEINF